MRLAAVGAKAEFLDSAKGAVRATKRSGTDRAALPFCACSSKAVPIVLCSTGINDPGSGKLSRIHSEMKNAQSMKPLLTIRVAALALGLVTCMWAKNTTARFEPDSPEVGPFPADSLTVENPAQKTGVQVSLPGQCDISPDLSACTDTLLLNQLDGFSVNPRITVCFSGPVDLKSLKEGIQILPVARRGRPIGINQILYDPSSNCAYAKPDAVLDQQSRYLIAVTDAVEDASGKPVKQEKSFKDCLKKGSDRYCKALSQAVERLDSREWIDDRLVTASFFTTLSATDWLEKARQLVNSPLTPAAVLPAGNPSSFALSNLQSITWIPQDNGPAPAPQPIPLSALQGVESIAFGLYLSPNFLQVSGPLAGSIPATPTAGPIVNPIPVPGLPANIPPGFVPISFHVFLPPASQMPPGGFPVVIYGHGLGDSQFGAPTYIASTLAAKGFATLAIEVMGHGFGPGGVVQLISAAGAPAFVATPGRGIALSPAGPIGPTDGCILGGPLAVRDCARQTAVDLFALVRTIQVTGGLGLHLDPSRVSYIGQSFGSTYGSLFHAVEPGVGAAVLNTAGGTSPDVSRLSPVGRQLGTFYLGSHSPPLLNVPPAPPQDYFHDLFNDNYVFRDNRSAVVNNVPGALEIQSAFEVADWLGMPGDPLAFASHLQLSPLAGVPRKYTLFQFALGDLEVPNPTNSAFIRTAGGQSSAWYLRFDKAVRSHPELLGVMMPGFPLPILPHRFLSNPTIIDPGLAAEASLARAAQLQAARFLKDNGRSNPDPNQFLEAPFAGMTRFEIPDKLPERLNFLQLQP